MYLARREAGKALQVFKNDGAERIPRAWIFSLTGADGAGISSAALAAGSNHGVAATGYTRSEAITNLHAAEELAAHA